MQSCIYIPKSTCSGCLWKSRSLGESILRPSTRPRRQLFSAMKEGSRWRAHTDPQPLLAAGQGEATLLVLACPARPPRKKKTKLTFRRRFSTCERTTWGCRRSPRMPPTSWRSSRSGSSTPSTWAKPGEGAAGARAPWCRRWRHPPSSRPSSQLCPLEGSAQHNNCRSTIIICLL